MNNYIYSTTKETYQSLLGAIMENKIKKNESIFMAYSLTFSSATVH